MQPGSKNKQYISATAVAGREVPLSIFEFIVGMISVIFALAVGQLFAGLAELLKQKVKVRFYLPHGMWVANLFLLIFLHWWSLWTFREIEWNFAMFFFSLLGPSIMFFACAMISPRVETTDEINLADHFLGIRKLFFPVTAVMVLLFSFDGPLFGTEPPINLLRAAQVAIFAVTTWGAFTTHRLAQSAIAAIVLAALSIIVFIRFMPGLYLG